MACRIPVQFASLDFTKYLVMFFIRTNALMRIGERVNSNFYIQLCPGPKSHTDVCKTVQRP